MKTEKKTQKILTAERQNIIYKMVTEQSSVQVVDLAEKFDVSVATIRRDLSEMEEKLRLQRVYGGAVAIKQSSYLPYNLRTDQRAMEKERIGAAAAELIEDGDTIVLDVGTTVRSVSKHLMKKNNITILTNNVSILSDFTDAPVPINATCFGGTLSQTQQAFLGSSAVKAIEHFYFDKAIIGTAGVDINSGLTSFSPESAAITSTSIKRAKEVILVTDSSKIGVTRYVEVAPISVLTTIVTDNGIKPEDKLAFENLGIRVVIA